MMRESNIIDTLKETVSIYDLMDMVSIKYQSRLLPHNISCPFHGADTKPSLRVYPDTNSMYCYTCDKTWDQISFWAQTNEWWTDEGTLDMGKAIADLCGRYNIRSIRPDWRKNIEANIEGAKSRRKGYSGVPMEQREELRTNYTYRVARIVKRLPDRSERWDDVRDTWDKLATVDIHSDKWVPELKEWYTNATEALAVSDPLT